MRDTTQSLLREQMPEWPWFKHVGEDIEDRGVIPVASWSDAIALCEALLWENTTLQIRNQLVEDLHRADWHRADQWNRVVEEAKLSIDALCNQFAQIAARNSLPDVFIHQVRWDLVGIVMETEYADIRPPNFNTNVLAPWYKRGHFPCGWDAPELPNGWRGEFPPYRLFVF